MIKEAKLKKRKEDKDGEDPVPVEQKLKELEDHNVRLEKDIKEFEACKVKDGKFY